MPISGLVEGEDEKGKEGEEDDKGEDSDTRPTKRMRMSADATIALIGIESRILDTERISRSASTSQYSSSSRSSSVSSLRSAMSIL